MILAYNDGMMFATSLLPTTRTDDRMINAALKNAPVAMIFCDDVPLSW